MSTTFRQIGPGLLAACVLAVIGVSLSAHRYETASAFATLGMLLVLLFVVPPPSPKRFFALVAFGVLAAATAGLLVLDFYRL